MKILIRKIDGIWESRFNIAVAPSPSIQRRRRGTI
jgi:hypothetical protein